MHVSKRLPSILLAACAAALAWPGTASASMFHGETLDKIADVMTIFVLVIVPITVIALFWMVHILPEKIAEKKHHPQTKAIQCLCLLSLVFGGMLWPLAWLWTYTKPTLHKLAYGTDKEIHETPEQKRERLRKELAEVETALGGKA
jgi:tellurite resistance protein TehA-like permease